MKNIRITNNSDEMIKIAKELVQINQSKYSDDVIKIIKQSVKSHLLNESDDEIEKMFWLSIYYYWVYGCTVDEFFYYRLYEKNYAEIKEYVLAHERVLYLQQLNREEDAYLLNNKYETYKLFKDYFLRDVVLIKTEDDLSSFLDFSKKHPEFVVKPVDSGCGHGVHKGSVVNLSDKEIVEYFHSLLVEAGQNSNKYGRNSQKALLLEEIIKQADELSIIHPASVNGIRIVTLRIDNVVKIYQAWWKIGSGGQFVTSAVYGTMDAGIDIDTGVVDTPGVTEKLEIREYHPDTGIRIVGYQIPKWNELIQTVKRMAERLSTISYVGWDMVLTKKGWCVMEGNFRGDFMWQMYRNKGCKKEFENIIGWKLDKEFWWKE